MSNPVGILIVTPTAPTTGPNTVYMPGGTGTSGFLCSAFGTASYPAGAGVTGVYGYIKAGAAATATDSEIISSGTLYSMSGTGSWNLNGRLNAAASMTMPYPDSTFFALSVYSMFDMGTFKYVTTTERSTVSFKGQGSASPCAHIALAARCVDPQMEMETVAPQEVHPVASEGGWLYYAHIPASALSLGCTLMRGGEPLSARTIAVAASDICWWHGDGQPQIVNRAIGDARMGSPVNMTFPDVVRNGIVLSHLASVPDLQLVVHAVTSECREHANLFSVDPKYPVKVQVNFDRTETFPRTGGYGLWVRVID